MDDQMLLASWLTIAVILGSVKGVTNEQVFELFRDTLKIREISDNPTDILVAVAHGDEKSNVEVNLKLMSLLRKVQVSWEDIQKRDNR